MLYAVCQMGGEYCRNQAEPELLHGVHSSYKLERTTRREWKLARSGTGDKTVNSITYVKFIHNTTLQMESTTAS